VAKDLTVRVDLPNGQGDSLTSLATADASNATAVSDNTAVNFSRKAKWQVRSGSTRITWDSNGDGVLDYNSYIWPNDDLFSASGINLGEQWGCNPFIIQISFWVDTEAVPTEEQPSGPAISIEKKVVWQGNEYDSVDRTVHLYDPGEEVEYQLTVRNSGDEEATGVRVIDTLPAYIRTLDGHESKEFDLGSLSGGGEWSTRYTAKVADSLPQNDRTQENTAQVTSDNAGDDSDSAFIWINGPEILATQAEAAATAAPPEQLPVTGPEIPAAAGLVSLIPVGVILRRRLF
jgi:uncharacterized repeat protein (TIGR01451 family)